MQRIQTGQNDMGRVPTFVRLQPLHQMAKRLLDRRKLTLRALFTHLPFTGVSGELRKLQIVEKQNGKKRRAINLLNPIGRQLKYFVDWTIVGAELDIARV